MGYVDGYVLLVTLVKNTICAHKSVIVILLVCVTEVSRDGDFKHLNQTKGHSFKKKKDLKM